MYKVPLKKITVTPNGWQHMLSITPSSQDIVEKFGLYPGKFTLSLSTVAPNKNLKWILDAAKKNPDITFAIAGSLNPTRFGINLDVKNLGNIKFLGYISDSDFVTLAKNCQAFIFPSFYEGFGLPPLEALSVGAPIVVSDIPVMHEIFGASVCYVNPFCYDFDFSKIRKQMDIDNGSILSKYNWKVTAKELLRWTM